MGLIFDTHAHYDDPAFDEDRKEILSGLLGNGVGKVVNAGAAVRSMPRILTLTREYDFIYGAAGLHPCEVYASGDNTGKPVMDFGFADNDIIEILKEYDPQELISPGWMAGDREEKLIELMLRDPRIAAVGEIGLDYHYDDTRKDIQREWFARQIAIAGKYSKPVIIHSRDAAADTLDMVRSECGSNVKGIVHCFSYSLEMAKLYVDMGFFIGIGGVLTYKNSKKLKEIVCCLPLESMVLETDCPYLAPSPFRGQRNDSSMIKYVVAVMAALKGISEEEILNVTWENAEKLFSASQANIQTFAGGSEQLQYKFC